MFGSGGTATVAERDDMAKKKARQAQEIILVYKADPQTSAEVKLWLEELAAHVGAPVTVTVDMALKSFAAIHKFRPMPKRLAR